MIFGDDVESLVEVWHERRGAWSRIQQEINLYRLDKSPDDNDAEKRSSFLSAVQS